MVVMTESVRRYSLSGVLFLLLLLVVVVAVVVVGDDGDGSEVDIVG